MNSTQNNTMLPLPNANPTQRKRKLEGSDGEVAIDVRKKRKLNPSPNHVAPSAQCNTNQQSPSISPRCADGMDKQNCHQSKQINANVAKVKNEETTATVPHHNPYLPSTAQTTPAIEPLSSIGNDPSADPQSVTAFPATTIKADSVESGEIISDNATPCLSIRLLLDAKHVGRLIGEAGCVITKIRDESGAKIHIAKHIPQSLFRICTMIGEEQQIIYGLKLIVDTIAERSMVEKIPSHQITILIEDKNTGNLIGKKGCAITEIRKNTNANIYISSHLLQRSSEKTVDICGQKNDVCGAIELVIHRLFCNKAHAETQTPYNPGMQVLYKEPPLPPYIANLPPCPTTHNVPMFHSPISYVPNCNSYNSQHTRLHSENTSNNDMFPFEERCKELYDSSINNMNNRNNSNMTAPAIHVMPPYPHAVNPLPIMPVQTQPRMMNLAPPAARVSFILPVASDFIGAVIGRGGRNIQDIRRRSNARIVIDSDPHNNKDERYISLNGTRQEISSAIFMIQSSLATHM